MKTRVKITIIERHEMVCNLLIPKTLIVAPRQSGKTEAIKKAIESCEYYKVFVPNKTTMDKFTGIKHVHLSREFKSLDVDSVAWKIFVDNIEFCGEDPNTKIPNITMETSRIYSATTSILNFDEIQMLTQVDRFNFERICIVGDLI